MILTALFIMLVYRLLGGIAAVALAGYGLISYALLLALGATLTLPGLAGFVLAIGMAVDANVLVFERAREEHAAAGTRGELDDQLLLDGLVVDHQHVVFHGGHRGLRVVHGVGQWVDR